MDVKHQIDKQRFYIEINGQTAYVDYKISNCELDIRHTIVPDALGGQGLASTLVRAAYDYAQTKGLKPVATCSYAVKWLEKHPEYQGSVGKDYGGDGTCAI